MVVSQQKNLRYRDALWFSISSGINSEMPCQLSPIAIEAAIISSKCSGAYCHLRVNILYKNYSTGFKSQKHGLLSGGIFSSLGS
jgi:hypothetical protein